MYDNLFIGFEFEFYSKIDLSKLIFYFEKDLNKHIEYFDKNHSQYNLNDNNWKLEKDYSGGKELLELVTYKMDYENATKYLKKIMILISKYGYTSDLSGLHINISFKNINDNYNINKLKLALDIDENKIFNDFPNRKKSPYTKSVKNILPTSKFYYENIENINNLDFENFQIPDSKYYGINFKKINSGYLEFRYLGGKNYEKKYDLILNYLNYFLDLMKKSLKPYTSQNKKHLLNIIKSKRALLSSYNSYKDFKREFPKINLYVNLVVTPSYIETFYGRIRDKLFEIINETGIKEGTINFNSDSSFFEIKDTIIEKCYDLEHIDFINCKLSGNFTYCNFFECDINTAMLNSCSVYQNSRIIHSKLKNCYVNNNSEIIKSNITGEQHTLILGKIDNCIFRNGKISLDAKENATNTEFVTFEIVN